MLSPEQYSYLQTMGIQVWVPRHPPLEPNFPKKIIPASNSSNGSKKSLAELQAEVKSCIACPLHQTRKQTVFGMGNPGAQLMLIGEAPGANEDRLGLPFVGRAGELLDKMLSAIGLHRDQIFITNILKCRPPQNRDPHPEEMAQCRGFLTQQIELIRPRMIVALGRIAAHQLLNVEQPLNRLRGTLHQLPQGIPLLVTYHPAYLLRNPSDKAFAWQDWLKLKSWLSEHEGI